ncbi:MAG: ABC transporter ATP-binding protein [Alphaproteobacteria bacterium]
MSLDIHSLSVRYGQAEVVRAVSVADLAPGSVTALVGPNAAGKSSLMRAVAGVTAAAAGRITLHGEALHGLSRADRAERVRYVPQTYASQARLPVVDAALVARMAGRRARPRPDDLAAAEAALARVGIGHLAERELHTLSGGQQQLAALAMGLARPAPVLLLDEPTSALDLRHQLHVLAVAREVARRDRRIVVVALHDLNLAARHADRVALMADGRIVGDGPPLDVLSSPLCGAAYGVRIDVDVTGRGTPVIEASL